MSRERTWSQRELWVHRGGEEGREGGEGRKGERAV